MCIPGYAEEYECGLLLASASASAERRRMRIWASVETVKELRKKPGFLKI